MTVLNLTWVRGFPFPPHEGFGFIKWAVIGKFIIKEYRICQFESSIGSGHSTDPMSKIKRLIYTFEKILKLELLEENYL